MHFSTICWLITSQMYELFICSLMLALKRIIDTNAQCQQTVLSNYCFIKVSFNLTWSLDLKLAKSFKRSVIWNRVNYMETFRIKIFTDCSEINFTVNSLKLNWATLNGLAFRKNFSQGELTVKKLIWLVLIWSSNKLLLIRNYNIGQSYGWHWLLPSRQIASMN